MTVRFRHTLGMMVLFGAALSVRAADPAAPTFTDAKAAGSDYQLQGEYKGKALSDEGEVVFGAQVVAQGDGKFLIVGFKGGLPGDGWSRGDEIHGFEATAVDGKITFEPDGAVVTIADGALTINANGMEVGKLEKVERKSPTLGKKAPKNATVLFDGTEKTLGNFVNGKLVEGKYLSVANTSPGITAKEKLGDHSLHLEFRTPFMPKSRGQGRGNSGVYVQGRYEVQVLDSFGLDGKNNECGGIYSIGAPAVNMCLPPLAWQTYDIDFTAARYDDAGEKVKNARITVRHNGVVIHDDVELKKGTPGKDPEGPEPNGLFLQDHTNPVWYRNIWVVKR